MSTSAPVNHDVSVAGFQGSPAATDTANARLRSSAATGTDTLARTFARWKQHGDRSAREELVRRFQPLARSLARRYHGSREPFEDLTQVAYLGLLKAIDRFDPSRGNRFAAFAVPTITGELRRYLRDTTWAVHVPRGAQERTLEVEQVIAQLTSRLGRSPTVGEIAQYLERDHEEVLDAMQISQARASLSLDAPRQAGAEEDAEPRIETIGVEEDGYALVEDGSAVAHALSSLGDRERQIIELRFGREMTQSEIAVEVGLSQMQISRLLRSSLAQMRQVAEGRSPG